MSSEFKKRAALSSLRRRWYLMQYTACQGWLYYHRKACERWDRAVEVLAYA